MISKISTSTVRTVPNAGGASSMSLSLAWEQITTLIVTQRLVIALIMVTPTANGRVGITVKKKPMEKKDPKNIDDVKIIIQSKGKHYAIVPKKDMGNKAKYLRILALTEIMEAHDIVSTALEDINPKNFDKKNETQDYRKEK